MLTMIHGVHFTEDHTYSSIAAPLKKLGRNAIRVVYAPHWGYKPDSALIDDLKRTKGYTDAGKIVLICWNTSRAPSSATEARDWFNRVADVLGNNPSVWHEALNETNLSQFWPTRDWKAGVTKVMKPCWEVMQPRGVTVVGTALASQGATNDTPKYKEMFGVGYLKYCHFANIHVYGETQAYHSAQMQAFRKLVYQYDPEKIVVATEWSFHRGGQHLSDAKIAAQMPKTLTEDSKPMPGLARFGGYWYYRLYINTTSPAGFCGLLNKTGNTPHQPFYDACVKLGAIDPMAA